ncbi:MAG: hypothetical protein ACOX3G_10665 [Armatimonadota bacterium]
MRNIILFIILIGLAANVAAAQGKEMRMLNASEFAILPWGSTTGDQSVYDTIRDCGFNLAGFVTVDELDKVNKAGLQCLVRDASIHAGDPQTQLSQAEIDERVQAVVKRVAGNPAVYGYYLRDEPNASVFPGLGRWAAAVEKADPGKMAYINLFPNYASAGALGTETYDKHLEEYVKQVKPKFISYDHYALMDDGSLRGSYFQNLESIRAAALKNNIPFWNIVLSNAHFNYAEPSPAGFRFQLYTTLAYGAKGISYFTYFAPHVGNYRLAPIDQFGHKTPTWDMLREVNLQLHKLGPVYITLKSVNVFHHPVVPDGCRGIESSKFIESVTGPSMLVGEFVDPDGQPYAMIVNTSLHNSTPFQVKFKEEGTIYRVSPYTGQTALWHGEDCWLAAGQGMLLCLKK